MYWKIRENSIAMKAYNNAVKRWATKLTINGKLTDKDTWVIECWISNASQDTMGLDDMLEDIYLMACDMASDIVDRFHSVKLPRIVGSNEAIERPIRWRSTWELYNDETHLQAGD